MKKQTSIGQKLKDTPFWVFGAFLLALITSALPAHAADLFSGSRTDIVETAGDGSVVHMAIMASGLIVAMIVGFVSKNWVAGIATFVIGVIFWSVGQTMVFS